MTSADIPWLSSFSFQSRENHRDFVGRDVLDRVRVDLNGRGESAGAKAFQLDKEMFKVKPATMTLIVITLALLMALYVKFW